MIAPKRNYVKLTITFLLATGTLAFNAHAKSTFPNYIPNASVSTAQGPCTNCHRDPSGGDTLTLFGQDVYATLEGRRPDWSALYYLDSDGDGQTNGQELGDPCGTWIRGEPAPRETDISNPTDETLTSADPDTPVCADGDTTDEVPKRRELYGPMTRITLRALVTRKFPALPRWKRHSRRRPRIG